MIVSDGHVSVLKRDLHRNSKLKAATFGGLESKEKSGSLERVAECIVPNGDMHTSSLERIIGSFIQFGCVFTYA